MKAVITTGGKQYIVAKGDELSVELLSDEKTVSFEPLMLFDDSNVTIGQPTVKDAVVKAKIIENLRAEKVTSIRYKKKNRVHKRRGHRQNLTKIQVSDISKK